MAGRLTPYRRKRDFTRTPEPRGRTVKRAPGALRFVVQKHAARRLHYDFRLEMGGVLKSWAIPKGPSLDPRVKRLAVHVEDHPLDYADFEGVIPEGEYGGGTVLVWDTGVWVPKNGDPERAYRQGMLKFELRGKKLRGCWALIRMAGRRGEKNWLLVKERDDRAASEGDDDIVDKDPRSVLSGRDLDAVARDRDRVWKSHRAARRQGRRSAARKLDPRTIAGARKSAQPATFRPQLAASGATVPAGSDWLHEIKFDGYRMLAWIVDGKPKLLSRNGQDWTGRFPAVAAALGALGLRQALLDGEVVHLEPSGVSSFSALKDDLARGDTAQITYCLFDLIHLRGYDLSDARLDARKAALEALLADAPAILRYSDHIAGRGEAFQRNACRMALEGVVSKRADAPYRPGRSAAWIKVKCQAREELVIIGWTDSKGRRSGIGSLLLGYYGADGALRFAGGVGTGFSDDMLNELHRRLAPLERPAAPSRAIAAAAPPRSHWAKPELVAELRFTEWTPDGRLRHPTFLGLREDKRAEEVIIDGVPPSATPALATANAPVEVGGVRITHAAKLLDPDSRTTKLDLARYYEAIAAHMLPELVGRPLTLLRCPDGRTGHCFFQKHATNAASAALTRLRVAENGKTATYLAVEDRAGLLSLAQMGVLEIHAWGATKNQLDQPDRLVFDLDPGEGLPWRRIVEAAVRVRDLLAEIGLSSFAKATGGKGLHVVVPIVPRYGWDEIKAFTRAIAEEMARREPAGYTASLAKRARRDRIFIDYLRNQRGATAVAAYSVRARPGVPVAVPLSWKEVEHGIRSDAFTLASLPPRLAKLPADPWHDLARLRQTLPAALRRRLRAA